MERLAEGVLADRVVAGAEGDAPPGGGAPARGERAGGPGRRRSGGSLAPGRRDHCRRGGGRRARRAGRDGVGTSASDMQAATSLPPTDDANYVDSRRETASVSEGSSVR